MTNEHLSRITMALATTIALLGLAADASAQQGSAAVIQNFISVNGAGVGSPACGGAGGGNTLSSTLNTNLGQSIDDENVAIDNRRAVFRYCDSLTTTGANGWSGAAAAVTGDQSLSMASAISPDEVFTGMDNAHAAAAIQGANVARRLSLVRLAMRRGDEDVRIARNLAPPPTSRENELGGFAQLPQQDRGERILLALQDGMSGGAPGSDGTGSGLGYFVNGRIDIVQGDQNPAERGSDGFGGGVTVGADRLVRDDLFAGAAVGYTHIDTKFDGTGSDASLNALTFSGYGSLFPTDASFVDGSISVSWLGFEQSNELLVVDGGAPLPTLHGDANGANFGFNVGGGWAFDVGELTGDEHLKALIIEPTARLGFLYTYIEDYELGGGDHSFDLRIDEQETTSLTANVGFRTEYPVSTRYGVLTPYFRASYVHEFLKENDDLNIGLAVVGGPTAKLKAQATDSHYANLGLGVSATLGQGLSQFVDYDVITSHENVEIHQITAGMRLEF